jgi:hypothetical protein
VGREALRITPGRRLGEAQALGDDNWGNWEIEDATIYHGVWLSALMGYADALGKLDDLFKTPEVYYYAHYFLNLMSPAQVVPDFGDAAWTQNWQHFFVFFEAAAARLNDPRWRGPRSRSREFIDCSTQQRGAGRFLSTAIAGAAPASSRSHRRPSAPR